MQAIFLFKLPHNNFLSFVIQAIARYAAIKTNPVRQDVNVLVLRIRVPGDHVLIMVEAHALQIPLAYFPPLFIRQMLTSSGR